MGLKSLGIVIASDRYPQYVGPLVRAAHAKGVAVHVHLTGLGVRLIQSIALDALANVAQITICRSSADTQRVPVQLQMRYTQMLTRADEMVRLINECDRHVVL